MKIKYLRLVFIFLPLTPGTESNRFFNLARPYILGIVMVETVVMRPQVKNNGNITGCQIDPWLPIHLRNYTSPRLLRQPG